MDAFSLSGRQPLRSGRMRVLALIALLAAMLLTGCTQAQTTSNDFSGEKKEVADLVGDLADDGQRKKADAICENLLADDLVKQVAAAGSSCASEMKKAIDDADGFDLEVTKVDITGTTAKATVRSQDRGKDVDRVFEFVKQDGDWRITGFGG
jgi:hypothetical protein